MPPHPTLHLDVTANFSALNPVRNHERSQIAILVSVYVLQVMIILQNVAFATVLELPHPDWITFSLTLWHDLVQ